MILVVADTAPLRYLVEIGYEYLLPRLFTKIWIPGAVVEELRSQWPFPPGANWVAWIAGSGRRSNWPNT